MKDECGRHGVLFPGEDWNDLADKEQSDIMDGTDQALLAASVTKTEWLLLTTLAKPESSKFRPNLLKYTANIGNQAQKDWAQVVQGDIVAKVREALAQAGSSSTMATGKQQSKSAKTEGGDCNSDEDKGKQKSKKRKSDGDAGGDEKQKKKKKGKKDKRE